jgi:hypothetical protein
MCILRYEMGDKKMSLSLNSNTVGWGCKVEALKDMGIHNGEYDTLVKIVSEIEPEVEIDDYDYGFEEAHVIGHGNSDGYKSSGYKIHSPPDKGLHPLKGLYMKPRWFELMPNNIPIK